MALLCWRPSHLCFHQCKVHCCKLIHVQNTHDTFNTNLPLGNFSRNVYFCLQMVKPLIILFSVCRILHSRCSLSFRSGFFCIKLHCKPACGGESELRKNLGTSSLPSLDFSRSLRIKAKSSLSFQSMCPSQVSISQTVGIHIQIFPVTSP